ncbi:Alpha/beta hydrolase fold-1 [Penicillium verhagenii]|nr:Alpha/beta hydrolase fold-1 [Penicillium verhagenii]
MWHSNTLHTIPLQVKGVKPNLSTIHYFNFNPPILFLHSFGSRKEDLADLSLHSSLQNYGLIAYDTPGCGQSDSTDLSITDIPFLVASAEAFLAHFQVNKFHLIGHSMGGLTGLRFIDINQRKPCARRLLPQSADLQFTA